jgi:hypothetical protein
VKSRTRLILLEKKKISCLCRESNHDYSVVCSSVTEVTVHRLNDQHFIAGSNRVVCR